MNLGVVMPVVLQNQKLLEMTLTTIRHLRIDPMWARSHELHLTFHLLCNRLRGWTEQELICLVRDDWPQPAFIEVVNDYERSVAGAWNHGIRQAMLKRADHFLVVANDARPEPGTIETLLDFGAEPANRQVALWSATAVGVSERSGGDGADFALFCLRLETIDALGWFDENFRPAYFEDNDYFARVVLSGRECRRVQNAPFLHLGSQTIRYDPEIARLVKYWFGINQGYFARKWGVLRPEKDSAIVRAKYFPTPFNSGKPLGYWARP